MLEANVIIIEELKKFVITIASRSDLLQQFKKTDSCFTRDRKLPFERLVLMIAKLCKKTLSLELETFFEELGVDVSYSLSAFTQQRAKLNESFFYCWNMVLCYNFYLHYGQNVKRWKGYRVIAGDGSSIGLFNNKALHAYFGGQSNQRGSYALGKIYCCYDVLNELILFPRLSPYRYAEVEMAYESIDHLESDMLMIYDRNFGNYKMAALHMWREKEVKFIIRMRESQKVIKEFIASGKSSAIVKLQPTDNAISGLKRSGYKINRNTELFVRLVRVELDKCIEVLMTNLWEEEGHPDTVFKDIYFMRWGIETRINFQKNNLQLESFSGLTPTAVLQDFYATAFVANLHALLIKDAQQTITNTTAHRKYPMKVNYNKSSGRLKKIIVSLFTLKDTETILKLLHDLFIKDIIPIRKGRNYPRKVINKKTRGKYTTFSNFKPAF
jgi:hypothetical protein